MGSLVTEIFGITKTINAVDEAVFVDAKGGWTQNLGGVWFGYQKFEADPQDISVWVVVLLRSCALRYGAKWVSTVSLDIGV